MAEFTVLMGGNRGDLKATFGRAIELIEGRIGIVLAISRDHWTQPWGFEDEQLFLNRAVLVASELAPAEVMNRLLAIEDELGRRRPAGGGLVPRTIDLDILFIGDLVIDTPALTVPHPRIPQRTFALGPAADIVPGLVHPHTGQTVLQMLNTALRHT